MTFDLSQPLIVFRFPTIVDIPRAVQAELQAEAEEAVEAIRDIKLLANHTEKCRPLSSLPGGSYT